MLFTGQHFAILGAARSGLGAARLAARNGAKVTLIDEGNLAKFAHAMETAQAEGLNILLGDDAKALTVNPGDFQLAILSPGFDVNWALPKKFSDAGTKLTGEMEFASTLTKMEMTAITGTNGKSTTTELLAAVFNGCGLRSIPCGNHGLAISELLVDHGEVFDMLANEVSSFQLETIETFHPHISMWLNFAPDHLDRYPDEAAYFAAKRRIFMNQTVSDWAIVNALDVELLGSLKPLVLTFSAQPEHEDATFAYRDGQFFHQGHVFGDASRIRLRGRHNMENVLAAIAAGWIKGLTFEKMLAAVAAYEPPAHRCQLVREWHGIEFINDSKATNLHALESCVRSLERPIVLIAGGKEKGLDYHPLRAAIPGKVQAMVLIGEIAGTLADAFGNLVPCQKAKDMAEAVTLAAAAAKAGDAVVLSPGTSSFDMYSGYAERGDKFRDAALALP
ncbi:MAG: UDP-N-acetylmuramoylalanine--D-glutamate ligase [Verrucomicrobiaceae bacterium]|nr:UDP-N-acetylmuramoylalanine--D-glutamate ligase [Verrucomicrobiaceae bacterium]